MNFSSRSSKTLYTFAVMAVALGVYAFLQSFGEPQIPHEFSSARLQGALISQIIVDSSNQLSADLKKVNELDQEGKYAEALLLTLELKNRNTEMGQQAQKLASELNTMAGVLNDINSREAEAAATEGVQQSLEMISHFINYNELLEKLLGVLKDKFEGRVPQGEKVSDLVIKINQEVDAVNGMNKKAGDSLDRFDKIIREN